MKLVVSVRQREKTGKEENRVFPPFLSHVGCCSSWCLHVPTRECARRWCSASSLGKPSLSETSPTWYLRMIRSVVYSLSLIIADTCGWSIWCSFGPPSSWVVLLQTRYSGVGAAVEYAVVHLKVSSQSRCFPCHLFFVWEVERWKKVACPRAVSDEKEFEHCVRGCNERIHSWITLADLNVLRYTRSIIIRPSYCLLLHLSKRLAG